MLSDKSHFVFSNFSLFSSNREISRSLFTRFGKIERYGQGLDDTDIQGSGLGLFISRELVKLHGGVIQAESPGRNKGSTFTVKLPLK